MNNSLTISNFILLLGLIVYFGCEEELEPEDCSGIAGGTAFENECNECVDGDTGLHENFCGTVTDIDGNIYKTVKIGNQIWMAENLKVEHFRNGNEIPPGNIKSYANDLNNVLVYGYLYKWTAVIDTNNIAPLGWHVPSDDEWKILEMELGMSQEQTNNTGFRGFTNEGSKIACNSDLWWNLLFSYGELESSNGFGESGFCALPAGLLWWDGYFINKGKNACFWSSTEKDSIYVWTRLLDGNFSSISRLGYKKQSGFSIRCIKD